MRATAAELSHTTAVAPPPQLRADVLAAITQVRPLAPVVSSNVVPLRPRRTARLWPALAAACALIAVLATGWGWQQHRSAQHSVSAQVSAVQSLLQAPDVSARTTNLTQGQTTVVYSRSLNKVVLVGHGIPILPQNRTYQLWAITGDGQALSAGIFAPNRSGDVEYPTTGNLGSAVRMGISIEPAGGSAKPTQGTVQVLNL